MALQRRTFFVLARQLFATSPMFVRRFWSKKYTHQTANYLIVWRLKVLDSLNSNFLIIRSLYNPKARFFSVIVVHVVLASYRLYSLSNKFLSEKFSKMLNVPCGTFCHLSQSWTNNNTVFYFLKEATFCSILIVAVKSFNVNFWL